jgi:hypothetical protein
MLMLMAKKRLPEPNQRGQAGTHTLLFGTENALQGSTSGTGPSYGRGAGAERQQDDLEHEAVGFARRFRAAANPL